MSVHKVMAQVVMIETGDGDTTNLELKIEPTVEFTQKVFQDDPAIQSVGSAFLTLLQDRIQTQYETYQEAQKTETE